eukprot:GFKZ01008165.1.p1 GENE.GFKZ01008165.1~~GFKZ01008165.1.p1  ORF type:complete len:179 (-),score=31.23 GFKZ01008165.1:1052-1510(-)
MMPNVAPPGPANGAPPLLMNATGMPQMRMQPPPPPQGQMRMPPQPGQGVPPPGPPGPPPVAPGQPPVDEQEAILQKVMTMSQQEINALAPEHRAYVMQLKEIVGRQNQGMGGAPGMAGGPGMGGMGPGPHGMQMGGGGGQGPPQGPPPGQYR